MRLLLASALLFLQAAPPPTPPPAEHFLEITDRFQIDMHTKDIDDVLKLYAPNAVFADPDGHTFTGPDQLQSLYKQVFATYDSDIDFADRVVQIPDASSANNTVTEHGNYIETLHNRNTNATQHLCGTYSESFAQQPTGIWLISEHHWTSSACKDSQLK